MTREQFFFSFKVFLLLTKSTSSKLQSKIVSPMMLCLQWGQV